MKKLTKELYSKAKDNAMLDSNKFDEEIFGEVQYAISQIESSMISYLKLDIEETHNILQANYITEITDKEHTNNKNIYTKEANLFLVKKVIED